MVSDALCGVAQSSEEHSPISLDSKKEQDLFLSILSRTPSPALCSGKEGIADDVDSLGKSQTEARKLEEEEEEEEDEELRELLRERHSTVSGLVLHRREKWSKEKLRKWIKQRKRKKMAEFAELRESTSTRARSQRSPEGFSHGSRGVKVRHTLRSICSDIAYNFMIKPFSPCTTKG